MTNPEILTLVQDHGLLLLAPLAVIEGPIMSVLGGSLSGAGLFNVWSVLAIVIAADLFGDMVLYWVGMRGGGLLPERLRARVLNPDSALQRRLRHELTDHGVRLLVLGKLTHGAGFAVLMAAGAMRYPFAKFVVVNLGATAIKSGALVALGWWLGDRWQRAEVWLDRAVVVVALAAVLGLAVWVHRKRMQRV
ncbi:VTT domain-containing protein [Rhodobacter sp. NTK016B]|uniref:DedA family protein n=1 Tax=Rhodobacter sp. NTK016B TaxID=2759676 RepID=UPI001A90BD4A|nr:VTT domain-containing protein [Rhodobacter sp. NTK016B]MBN8293464.1 VTT domain-containing protein [Rhodobacter sp. NTK016B]